MRILSRVCSVLSWGFLAITLFLHGLLILTLWMPPFFSAIFGMQRVENPVNERALPFVVVGTILFVAGFFLFRFLRRGRWGWYAAMTVGAIILAGVGLYLKVSYPETVVSDGVFAGYDSAFKLVWRHMLPLAVMLLQLLARVFLNAAESRELRREAVQDIQDEGFTPRFE